MTLANDLLFEIDAVRAGSGDPRSLVTSLRDALLLVPTEGEFQLVTGEYGGQRWICAFTSGEELARFARERDDAEREWSYVVMRGARLVAGALDAHPDIGIVVDISGRRPMAFPTRAFEDRIHAREDVPDSAVQQDN